MCIYEAKGFGLAKFLGYTNFSFLLLETLNLNIVPNYFNFY